LAEEEKFKNGDCTILFSARTLFITNRKSNQEYISFLGHKNNKSLHCRLRFTFRRLSPASTS
ncbi:TPA: hypothetical protein ACRR48_005252, partial [Klebsiella quasipneumoniae]